ncbi:MAG: 3-isopropylmalate dehydratase small subunit [Chloroflexi bacterium HGW-Chloroflexi-10]|nr:MAG: 3-isopropylmalate dehydratase small subunit [Chloroflexi bacterium HGW-Chloroflexi-10]
MSDFTTLTSHIVPVLVNDIDTDQIIPARFLKGIDKQGLGNNLFYDWRYLPDGSPNPDFILNQAAYRDAKILLAGDNFGCGSSREHAPWALTDFGLRAIISTSFADIFYNNALKNGLLPVAIPQESHSRLVTALQQDPFAQASIDLASQQVNLPGGEAVTFPIDSFSKHCLLQGVDEMGYLLSFLPQVEAFEHAQA